MIDYEKIRDIVSEETGKSMQLIEATYLKKDSFNRFRIGLIVFLSASLGGAGGLFKMLGIF